MLLRLFLLALLLTHLSGCQEMARGVSKMYGIQGDPFPGTCAPSSWQAGYCVKAGVQEGKP
jgi:hypothetical protein